MDLKFSPSSSYRWFACPASVRMTAHFGIDGTSEAAIEGILAHELAEQSLKNSIHPELFPSCHTPESGFEDIEISKQMRKHVANYVGRVEKLINFDSEIFIEHKFKLKITNDVTINGIADAVIVDHREKLIRVIDFKYGKRKVTLTNNSQMYMYALLAYKKLRDYDNIILQIIQPRIDHYPSIQLDKHDIDKFEEKLKSKIYDCLNPTLQFNTGEHCRYCPAKIECSAFKLPKTTINKRFAL